MFEIFNEEGYPVVITAADGKGVDLYKLATFNLAAVQALAGEVRELKAGAA